MQRQTDFHNEMLQQKMKSIEEDVTRATAQVQEVIKSPSQLLLVYSLPLTASCLLLQLMRTANLDPTQAEAVMASVKSTLATRNDLARSLRFRYLAASRKFDDTRQTVLAKMAQLGVEMQGIDLTKYNSDPIRGADRDGVDGANNDIA